MNSLDAAAVAYPLVLAVLQVGGCLVTGVFPHSLTVSFTLLVFVLLFTSPLMVIAWAQASTQRTIGRRLLALECPVCRYGLQGVAPQADACTVCPECGAAWRLQPSLGTSTRSS